MPARGWGPWTEVKLEALERYLHAFTVASQKAPRTLYLDLMAGSPSNTSRETGREVAGSAERALSTVPAFSRVVLCELQARTAQNLRRDLTAKHPGRGLVVLPGDCNEQIPRYLRELDYQWRYAPTFAFVDQFSAEIHWATLRHLAQFRRGAYKVELWFYFGESFLPRGLANAESVEPRADYAERVDLMFGDRHWRQIYSGRYRGDLTPGEAKNEYVNLMRWQLQMVLGYKTTLPLQIVRSDGHPLYTMIFATDHDVGSKVMTSVLAGAERDLEAMVARTKARKTIAAKEAFGQDGLFDFEEALQTPAAHAGPRLMLDPPREPWAFPAL